MFEITIGHEMSQHATWGEPWPALMDCHVCGKKADLFLVVYERPNWDFDLNVQAFAYKQWNDQRKERPKGFDRGDAEPRDLVSIANYVCTHCGEMTALWNQA